MDLLTSLYRDSLDPGYAASGKHRTRWWLVGLVAMVIGLMIGTSVADQLRAAPAEQVERDQLVQRIEDTAAATDALRARAAELQQQNRSLSEGALAKDPAAAEVQRQLDLLGPATGMQAVTGPGVVLTADDADDAERRGSKVVDIDIRQAVNGLWRSGAEAIAVNGHRLSSRTAIRGAGDAITVDYRSLTRPYRIEAIGDPNALLQDFPGTPGGAWWAYLKQNYGIRYELTSAGNLRLNADPGLGVRNARRKP
ncbi:DUF881 domain-containing protein [Micropruina sp.]|uniref:DUF881 domain-containing protein n=1 Tax=Micropruina sp. TaxID=2737536 RepID=UPI002637111F|nr:DUF881 domain-containing protein [Micropruina sp.]